MGNFLCKELCTGAASRGASHPPPAVPRAKGADAAVPAAGKAAAAAAAGQGGAKPVGLGDVQLEEAPGSGSGGGAWRISAARADGEQAGGGTHASAQPSAAGAAPSEQAEAPAAQQAQEQPQQQSEQQPPQQQAPQQQAPAPAPAATLPGISAPRPAAAAPLGGGVGRRVDKSFKECYRLGDVLGKGGFAVVRRVTERSTGSAYAVKIMTLPPAGREPSDNESTREDIFKEIDILCGLDHGNVVWLKEYFEEGGKVYLITKLVYLITELVTGGELLEAVIRRGAYGEGEAGLCFLALLRGIEYLHSRNVVHRDLKLENLLLASPDDITKVKIADFGLAKRAPAGAVMSTVCGTPQYVAPEVIQGTPGLMYGPQVDMWSSGVVLYILLSGYPPFYSDSEPALFDMIRRGAFSFDDPAWRAVSEGAKDLIRQLLAVDPHVRPTATQCLQHPWMRAAAAAAEAAAGGAGGGGGGGGGEPLAGAHARLRQAYEVSRGREGFVTAKVAGRDAGGA
ncbi:MAG: kinase-like domain-containing protein [Monoraphidium minutum]|nr:MAG: kinase-like domain-containing protein [Monoraphidium minutum]